VRVAQVRQSRQMPVRLRGRGALALPSSPARGRRRPAARRAGRTGPGVTGAARHDPGPGPPPRLRRIPEPADPGTYRKK